MSFISSIVERARSVVRRPSPSVPAAETHLESAEWARAYRSLLEARGDIVDPREYLQDGWENWTDDRLEREIGRSVVLPRDERELAQSRKIGRILGATCPGKGALKAFCNYVMGTGLSAEVQPRKGRKVPPELITALQEEVDEFTKRTDWTGARERDIFIDRRETGETYLLPYLLPNGRLDIKTILPDWIKEPDGRPEPGRSYLMGVDVSKDDPSVKHGYWVNWPGTERCEYVTEQEVIAKQINSARSYPRGISDFEGIRGQFFSGLKIFRNTGQGAALQASIAWIEQMAEGITAEQVQDMRSVNSTMSMDRSYPGYQGAGKTRTEYSQATEGGTVRHVENGRTMAAIPLNGNAGQFIETAKALFCLGGTVWQMPEYLLMSDATGTVYASALAAEAPFTKNCEVEQAAECRFQERVFSRVLEIAIRSYRFRDFNMSIRDLWDLVEVVVSGPEVATRDPEKATARNEKLYLSGRLSGPSWSEREGLDPDEEAARGARPGGDAAAVDEPTEPNPAMPGTTEARLSAAARLLWEGYP